MVTRSNTGTIITEHAQELLSQQRAEEFSTFKIDQEPLPDLRCWKPKASYRIDG